MRVMFGVVVIGAGIVGLTTLLAPRLATQYIFAGSVEVVPHVRSLGALWLALGTAAAFGLLDPRLIDRFNGLAEHSSCRNYVARATERPAFLKARADQTARFSAAD